MFFYENMFIYLSTVFRVSVSRVYLMLSAGGDGSKCAPTHGVQSSAVKRSIGFTIGFHNHKGQTAIRHYANQPTCPLPLLHLCPNFMST